MPNNEVTNKVRKARNLSFDEDTNDYLDDAKERKINISRTTQDLIKGSPGFKAYLERKVNG